MTLAKIPRTQIARNLKIPRIPVNRAPQEESGQAAKTDQALSRSDAGNSQGSAPCHGTMSAFLEAV